MRAQRSLLTWSLGLLMTLGFLLQPYTGIASDEALNRQLLKVAERGDLPQVKALLTKGADVNAKDSDKDSFSPGWTVLMYAAGGGNLEMVKLLIAKGADVNAKTSDGSTVLMSAAGGGELGSGDLEVVKLLIDKGADVNAKTNDGSTAMSRANYRNRTEIVEYLKSHGAK